MRLRGGVGSCLVSILLVVSVGAYDKAVGGGGGAVGGGVGVPGSAADTSGIALIIPDNTERINHIHEEHRQLAWQLDHLRRTLRVQGSNLPAAERELMEAKLREIEQKVDDSDPCCGKEAAPNCCAFNPKSLCCNPDECKGDCSRKPVTTKQPRASAEDFEPSEVTCDSDAQAAEGFKVCSPHATCQNSKCVCDADGGYSGDGMICEFNDPCENEVVGPNEVCVSPLQPDELGGPPVAEAADSGTGAAPRAERKCGAGYEKSPKDCKLGQDGCTCKEVEACKEGSCPPKTSVCLNTAPGQFQCRCNPGWLGEPTCSTPVKACDKDTPCSKPIGDKATSKCEENPDEPLLPKCTCEKGFIGNGFFCREEDPCHQSKIVCQEGVGRCVATAGTATCECIGGYKGDGIKTCVYTDPCKTNPAVPHATCFHSGSGEADYRCDLGYHGDGKRCDKVEPCKFANGGCSPDAKCKSDEKGFVTCECDKSGFVEGDGISCFPIVMGPDKKAVPPLAMGFKKGRVTAQGKDIASTDVAQAYSTACASCDINARCWDGLHVPLYNIKAPQKTLICTCNSGYTGDGKAAVGEGKDAKGGCAEVDSCSSGLPKAAAVGGSAEPEEKTYCDSLIQVVLAKRLVGEESTAARSQMFFKHPGTAPIGFEALHRGDDTGGDNIFVLPSRMQGMCAGCSKGTVGMCKCNKPGSGSGECIEQTCVNPIDMGGTACPAGFHLCKAEADADGSLKTCAMSGGDEGGPGVQTDPFCTASVPEFTQLPHSAVVVREITNENVGAAGDSRYTWVPDEGLSCGYKPATSGFASFVAFGENEFTLGLSPVYEFKVNTAEKDPQQTHYHNYGMTKPASGGNSAIAFYAYKSVEECKAHLPKYKYCQDQKKKCTFKYFSPGKHGKTEQPGFACVCRDGYKVKNGKKKCEAVNPCDTNQGGCNKDSTCVYLAPGMRQCKCNHGFRGDGVFCASIDPCLYPGIHKCPQDTTCEKTLPVRLDTTYDHGWTGKETGGLAKDSFKCKPLEGYTMVKDAAVVTNPCDSNSGCSDQATCLFTGPVPDSKGKKRTCKCNAGFHGTGETCTANVAPCSVDNGGCHGQATCTDPTETGGKVKCECNDAFEGNGLYCGRKNLCATDNGGCNKLALCLMDPSKATSDIVWCVCKRGYTGTGSKDESGCAPVDVCTLDSGTKDSVKCPDKSICRSTGPGAAMCVCADGYTLDAATKTCKEINLCLDPTFKATLGLDTVNGCPLNAECTSTGPGRRECKCKKGYAKAGRLCVAIYQCGVAHGGCDKDAGCELQGDGKTSCACNKGFHGNGIKCSQVEQCDYKRLGCHPKAFCGVATNAVAGEGTGLKKFKCVCRDGYDDTSDGAGKVCVPVNKCTATKDGGCGENQRCITSGPGALLCVCKSGFVPNADKTKGCVSYVPASFKKWEDWTTCNKPCGTGTRTRKRDCTVKTEGACGGEHKQTALCNLHQCQTLPQIDKHNQLVCPAPLRTSGYVTSSKVRANDISDISNYIDNIGPWMQDLVTEQTCVYKPPVEPALPKGWKRPKQCPPCNGPKVAENGCAACPTPGKWEPFTQGECKELEKCGLAFIKLTRTCAVADPGAMPCAGMSHKEEHCQLGTTCKVDGDWGTSIVTKPCSAETTGQATLVRGIEQVCNGPPPRASGTACPDTKSTTKGPCEMCENRCHKRACPANSKCVKAEGAVEAPNAASAACKCDGGYKSIFSSDTQALESCELIDFCQLNDLGTESQKVALPLDGFRTNMYGLNKLPKPCEERSLKTENYRGQTIWHPGDNGFECKYGGPINEKSVDADQDVEFGCKYENHLCVPDSPILASSDPPCTGGFGAVSFEQMYVSGGEKCKNGGTFHYRGHKVVCTTEPGEKKLCNIRGAPMWVGTSKRCTDNTGVGNSAALCVPGAINAGEFTCSADSDFFNCVGPDCKTKPTPSTTFEVKKACQADTLSGLAWHPKCDENAVCSENGGQGHRGGQPFRATCTCKSGYMGDGYASSSELGTHSGCTRIDACKSSYQGWQVGKNKPQGTFVNTAGAKLGENDPVPYHPIFGMAYEKNGGCDRFNAECVVHELGSEKPRSSRRTDFGRHAPAARLFNYAWETFGYTCNCRKHYFEDTRNNELCKNHPDHPDRSWGKEDGGQLCLKKQSICTGKDYCKGALYEGASNKCFDGGACVNNAGAGFTPEENSLKLDDSMTNFICTCPAGYKDTSPPTSKAGTKCEAINHCDAGTHTCRNDGSEECKNDAPGKFKCVCSLNYWKKDGISCTPINRCTTIKCETWNDDGDCAPMTTFPATGKEELTVGEVTVKGKDAKKRLYEGEGVEKILPHGGCSKDASCTDFGGNVVGVKCSCNPGYHSAPGNKCLKDDICQGLSNPCDANAECAEVDGKAKCTCSAGFVCKKLDAKGECGTAGTCRPVDYCAADDEKHLKTALDSEEQLTVEVNGQKVSKFEDVMKQCLDPNVDCAVKSSSASEISLICKPKHFYNQEELKQFDTKELCSDEKVCGGSQTLVGNDCKCTGSPSATEGRPTVPLSTCHAKQKVCSFAEADKDKDIMCSKPLTCDSSTTCAAHATCKLLHVGLHVEEVCACDAGYEGSDASTPDGCKQIECPADYCHPNSKCSSTDTGFSCVCNEGFEGYIPTASTVSSEVDGRPYCVPTDVCAGGGQPAHSTCTMFTKGDATFSPTSANTCSPGLKMPEADASSSGSCVAKASCTVAMSCPEHSVAMEVKVHGKDKDELKCECVCDEYYIPEAEEIKCSSSSRAKATQEKNTDEWCKCSRSGAETQKDGCNKDENKGTVCEWKEGVNGKNAFCAVKGATPVDAGLSSFQKRIMKDGHKKCAFASACTNKDGSKSKLCDSNLNVQCIHTEGRRPQCICNENHYPAPGPNNLLEMKKCLPLNSCFGPGTEFNGGCGTNGWKSLAKCKVTDEEENGRKKKECVCPAHYEMQLESGECVPKVYCGRGASPTDFPEEFKCHATAVCEENPGQYPSCTCTDWKTGSGRGPEGECKKIPIADEKDSDKKCTADVVCPLTAALTDCPHTCVFCQQGQNIHTCTVEPTDLRKRFRFERPGKGLGELTKGKYCVKGQKGGTPVEGNCRPEANIKNNCKPNSGCHICTLTNIRCIDEKWPYNDFWCRKNREKCEALPNHCDKVAEKGKMCVNSNEFSLRVAAGQCVPESGGDRSYISKQLVSKKLIREAIGLSDFEYRKLREDERRAEKVIRKLREAQMKAAAKT